MCFYYFWVGGIGSIQNFIQGKGRKDAYFYFCKITSLSKYLFQET